MIRLLALAACSWAVVGCTGAGQTEAARPEASPTTQPSPVIIAASKVCGPTDGLAVLVEIEGAEAHDFTAEIVLGGEVVASSGESALLVASSDGLLLDVPWDSVRSVQNDILTTLDITDAEVRIRQVGGGSVVAADRTIAPLTESCG